MTIMEGVSSVKCFVIVSKFSNTGKNSEHFVLFSFSGTGQALFLLYELQEKKACEGRNVYSCYDRDGCNYKWIKVMLRFFPINYYLMWLNRNIYYF